MLETAKEYAQVNDRKRDSVTVREVVEQQQQGKERVMEKERDVVG